MAWAALCARALSLVLLLPLVLRTFPAETVTVWLAFNAIAVLHSLCDLGFNPTFTRLVAYAVGGDNHVTQSKSSASASPTDWDRLLKIAGTMRALFSLLAVASLFILGFGGSLYLAPLIAATKNPHDCWLAWTVVVATLTMLMYGAQFSVLLNGLHRVALVRRWEALASFLATLSGSVVLLLGGSITELAIAQAWSLLTVAMLRRSWRLVIGQLGHNIRWAIHVGVMKSAWPAAWRSQIGMLTGLGTIQAAGLVYARVATAAEAAPFLFALRLMTSLVQFSTPPFYTRLPLLATLYARGHTVRMLGSAVRGIAGSSWTFAAGALIGGVLMPFVLDVAGSRTPFVSQALWSALALGFYAERVGSMHLQLCGVTNRINWHIANGVGAALFVGAVSVLIPITLEYAIPCSMLIAYGFLSFYSVMQLRDYFALDIGAFVLKSTAAPAIVLAGFLAMAMT